MASSLLPEPHLCIQSPLLAETQDQFCNPELSTEPAQSCARIGKESSQFPCLMHTVCYIDSLLTAYPVFSARSMTY